MMSENKSVVGPVSPARARKAFAITRSVTRAAIALGCLSSDVRKALSMPDRRGRKPVVVSPEEKDRLLRLLDKYKSTRAAAKAAGMSQTTFLRRVRRAAPAAKRAAARKLALSAA